MKDNIRAGDRRAVIVLRSSSEDWNGANIRAFHWIGNNREMEILDCFNQLTGQRANFFMTKEKVDLTGQLVVIEMLEERYSPNPEYSIWKVVEGDNQDERQ